MNKPKWLMQQDYDFIENACTDYASDIIGMIEAYNKQDLTKNAVKED